MAYKRIEGTTYEVSKTGKVRNAKTKKLLKPFVNHNKYLRVTLHIDGRQKKYMVHVLVAKAFIDNPNNLSDVNHKDNNRKNNHVKNLEWVSHSDNIKQVWLTGGFKHRRRTT